MYSCYVAKATSQSSTANLLLTVSKKSKNVRESMAYYTGNGGNARKILVLRIAYVVFRMGIFISFES